MWKDIMSTCLALECFKSSNFAFPSLAWERNRLLLQPGSFHDESPIKISLKAPRSDAMLHYRLHLIRMLSIEWHFTCWEKCSLDDRLLGINQPSITFLSSGHFGDLAVVNSPEQFIVQCWTTENRFLWIDNENWRRRSGRKVFFLENLSDCLARLLFTNYDGVAVIRESQWEFLDCRQTGEPNGQVRRELTEMDNSEKKINPWPTFTVSNSTMSCDSSSAMGAGTRHRLLRSLSLRWA